MGCPGFCSNLVRKKDLSDDMREKELRKVLTLSDLTFLAIASMIGSGIYVLTGSVASKIAGPSVVVSYVIAAIASGFSAICYAEFAARIPVTGSAYQFAYLAVGEVWAYAIGWSVFLEHAVAVAAIAKAWSGYLDGVFNHTIQGYLIEHVPMPGGLLSTYPDFVGGATVLVTTIIIAVGAKISSRVNIVFEVLNLAVLIFIFCTGMILARGEYWTAKGAFFPYGWSGTISGASTLIFSYVGYEVVASATEEAINPKRDIPLSLLISLIVTVISYVGASAALTLMVPWNNITISSPFPSAYSYRGWDWAKYIVSIGAIAAMSAAMISTMVVSPRYIYALARDGLIMPFFKKINEKTGVPLSATIVSGLISFLLAIIFALITLVEFISIGQLTACTFVSICVIKLRYEPNEISKYESFTDEDFHDDSGGIELQEADQTGSISHKNGNDLAPEAHLNDRLPKDYQSTDEAIQPTNGITIQTNEENAVVPGTVKNAVLESKFGHLFQWTLNFTPGVLPFYLLLIAVAFSTVAIVLIIFAHQYLNQWWCILLLVFTITASLFALMLITTFNQDKSIRTFKVPFVPFVPFISILINLLLIFNLKPLTWIRFLVWLAIGMLIYVGYGYRHSKARKTD